MVISLLVHETIEGVIDDRYILSYCKQKNDIILDRDQTNTSAPQGSKTIYNTWDPRLRETLTHTWDKTESNHSAITYL